MYQHEDAQIYGEEFIKQGEEFLRCRVQDESLVDYVERPLRIQVPTLPRPVLKNKAPKELNLKVSGETVRELNKIFKIYSENRRKLNSLTSRCAVCNSQCQDRCARCRKTHYCSRTCQAKDWPQHKTTCQ